MKRGWLVIGALLGGLAVGLGAVGAHVSPRVLDQLGYEATAIEQRMVRFNTASQYLMYHAMALVLVGLVSLHQSSKRLQAAGVAFLAGIVLFCGLLYAMTFGGDDWKFLRHIVPYGGGSFMVGWVLLALAACSGPPRA